MPVAALVAQVGAGGVGSVAVVDVAYITGGAQTEPPRTVVEFTAESIYKGVVLSGETFLPHQKTGIAKQRPAVEPAALAFPVTACMPIEYITRRIGVPRIVKIFAGGGLYSHLEGEVKLGGIVFLLSELGYSGNPYIARTAPLPALTPGPAEIAHLFAGLKPLARPPSKVKRHPSRRQRHTDINKSILRLITWCAVKLAQHLKMPIAIEPWLALNRQRQCIGAHSLRRANDVRLPRRYPIPIHILGPKVIVRLGLCCTAQKQQPHPQELFHV